MQGFRFALAALLAALLAPSIPARAAGPVPVLFDTDIGTDIDDAYALVALAKRPEFLLLGVTTVSSDARQRAQLAAKLLAILGLSKVPVYAGISTAPQNMRQVEWAAGFRSKALHESGGVEFLKLEIERRPGAITIIAVGELTNIAALLESDPAIAPRIKAIALMGGSIYRGYAAGSKPEPEWNIKSNAAAAKVVFESGVPLLVAPLDSTADLKLTPEMRVDLFRRGTPTTDALAALNSIWRHTNHWGGVDPTLFDVLAVELVAPRKPYALEALHLDVSAEGFTTPVPGRKPNAQVAVKIDAAEFMRDFVVRIRQ